MARGVTLGEAIRNAVEAEAAAARFYRLLAEQTGDPDARRFFEQMVEVEDDHGEEIESIGRKLIEGRLPTFATQDARIVETAPQWAYAENLTIDQALQVALECETQAALYYDALADHLQPPGSGFFRMVARAEEQHAQMIAGALQQRLAARTGSLTLRAALHHAIDAEQQAADCYLRLAEQSHDSHTRQFLLDMARVERQHAADIQAMSAKLHAQLAAHHQLDASLVETPPVWSIDPKLDLASALRIALEAEHHAALYYRGLARHLDPADAAFFQALANTEDQHAQMIEQLLSRAS